jgi:hypothetical protein
MIMDPRIFELLPEDDELLEEASRLLEPEADKVEAKALHWIGGYEGCIGDTYVDQGQSFCWGCADLLVKTVNTVLSIYPMGAERDEEKAFVDGGWGSDADGSESCERCGCVLDVSYTDYGFESEFDHFLSGGMIPGPGRWSYDSHACRMLVDSWTIPDDLREQAYELATRIIWNFMIAGK